VKSVNIKQNTRLLGLQFRKNKYGRVFVGVDRLNTIDYNAQQK
jgi:hypothetical protein